MELWLKERAGDMSIIQYDPDEWEPVFSSGGDSLAGTGWAQFGWRQRPPEEVDRIRAERRRAHENAVLAEADAIRASRAADAPPQPKKEG